MRRIAGVVQPYAWGSPTAIPELLGRQPDGTPIAELWFGAHPGAPSSADGESLLTLIEREPATVLGPDLAARYGRRLPFLLKVLAAAKPLSLQAHPTRAWAERRYAEEEAAGVPADAAHRLYRDAWPKPEMFCALGEVEALCGFREPAETHALFARLDVEAADRLVAPLHEGGAEELREVLGRLLRMTDDEREVVPQVVAAAAEVEPGDPDLELFARTAVELDGYYPGDPGVLAALLMNRVHYGRNEAMFLPAGNLHAYLRGTGIEIMANSDNVLRGGLTAKHIDVEELLSVVDFNPGRPGLVSIVEVSPGVWHYQSPAPEFTLWRCEPYVEAALVPGTGSPRIMLVVEGELRASDGSQELLLGRGQALLALPGEALTMSGTGTAFLAGPGPGGG